MKKSVSPICLTLLLALGGCESEKPFIATDYRFHQRGVVQICYDEAHEGLTEAQKLSDEVCRQYDRISRVQLIQPGQCAWTAPTLATFTCQPRPGETPGPILQHNAPMRHDTPLPPW